MSAPIVTPGGAAQPPLGPTREGGRRDEPSPGDGTFAALLAALAPAAVQPGAGLTLQPGDPAAGVSVPAEGQAPLTGAVLVDPLQPLAARLPQGGGQPALGAQAPLLAQVLPALAEAQSLAGETVPDGQQSGGPTGLPAQPAAAQPDAGDDLTDVLLQGPGTGSPDGNAAPSGGPVPAQGDGAAPAAAELTPAPVPSGEGSAPAGQPAGPGDGQQEAAPWRAGQPEGLTPPGSPGQAGGTGGDPAADGGGLSSDDATAAEPGPADPAARPAAELPPGLATDRPADPPPAAGTATAGGLERLTAGRLQAEQVMAELSRTVPELSDGEYRLTLRLHPEHLGEVRLELRVSGREVYTVMEVSSSDARQALESRGEQLRQGLSDAGYNLSGFEVATGQGRQPRQQGGEQQEDWLRPAPRSAGRTEAPAAPAVSFRRSAGPRGGRLDTLA